jgi:hypothetical protein
MPKPPPIPVQSYAELKDCCARKGMTQATEVPNSDGEGGIVRGGKRSAAKPCATPFICGADREEGLTLWKNEAVA